MSTAQPRRWPTRRGASAPQEPQIPVAVAACVAGGVTGVPWPQRLADQVRAWDRSLRPQLGRGAGRMGHRVTALLLLALGALPAGLLLAVGRRRRPLLAWNVRLGRHGQPFREYVLVPPTNTAGRVMRALRLQRLPSLVHVLRDEMSLVGPRAAGPRELSLRRELVRQRCRVPPGLVCLWWIRKRANIAYGEELAADVEYVESRGLGTDLGIALRALPVSLYSDQPAATPERVRILDILLDNVTLADAVEAIATRVETAGAPGQVCFVNAHCANLAQGDGDYRRVLQEGWLRLADGIGLKLAGRLVGEPIRENVNGTDLFPRLCRRLEGTGQSVFLLGGRPGVAEDVCRWLERHHPGLRVAGCQHGYSAQEDAPAVARAIAASGAGLLLVALGAPHQEKWIATHLPATGVRVAAGVGGLFDFYSGRMPRAPQWLRELGLEWAYRLLREPGRMWRRYLVGNTVFLARVLAAKRRSAHAAVESVPPRMLRGDPA